MKEIKNNNFNSNTYLLNTKLSDNKQNENLAKVSIFVR